MASYIYNRHIPKILHLITSLDVGGAEVMLSRLMSTLGSDRNEHQVVCLTSMGVVGKKIQLLGVKVTPLDMPQGCISLSGLRRLSYILKTERPLILQTWLYHSDLIGLLIGRMMGIKTIVWNLRCAFIDLKRYRISTKIVLKLCALLSSLPDAIISNSENAIRYHKELGYRNESWHLIPNGVDTSIFFPNQSARESFLRELDIVSDKKMGDDKPEKDILLVGCVARFDPMKDYETLIEGAKLVIEESENVFFVLVGRNVDWHNPFFIHAIPSHIRSRFYLLGERNDIATIMASLDIFLLTSYGEGFPNVLCEAMATAVPCIATDVGDCRRILGDTGFIVQTKNPQQISEAIKGLSQASSLERRLLGEKARQRVIKHYTLEAITKRYEALYRFFQQTL